ncbi:MAG: hypothetical protein P9L96_00595 [Candidatus Gygaella obscura]|nr:hypothetical protein [Candidatus Gygaella obscura]
MKIDNLKESILVWGTLSDEALMYLKQPQKDNALNVIVAENRPFLLGIKYNVLKLNKENIPFVYCTDNMLGFLFYRKKISQVVICYKKKEKKSLLADSGSLFAVLLAKLHNVKVRAFPQGNLDYSTLDKNSATLDGKAMLLDEDKDFVQETKDELIKEEFYEHN